MLLGRVVGRVWSTVKDSRLDGHCLLVVQPVSVDLKPTGKRLICTDSTGAGAGELVYWTRSKEAAMPFLPEQVPVDATITGIVDSLHFKKA